MGKTSNGFAYSWGISEVGEMGRPVPPLKIKAPPTSEEDMVYDVENILKKHLTPNYIMVKNSQNRNEITPIEDVKTIGSGSYHALIVTVGNHVFSTGLNNYSQLGHGDLETRYLLEKVLALENKNIIAVKGGIHHSLVMSNDAKLYAFGRGDSGQLGHKEMMNKDPGSYSTRPLLIEIKDNSKVIPIKSIACGGNHNLVLATTNDVYTWG